MKLKAIEISGFKSFANKVRLEFTEGITAIVGPNGCGKTNVIEAVRWVLGEQNIRTLRGERMEEVIFNGTAERKPLGLAEVRLFFLDPDQRMGFDAEEFVVGRQIFRDGESNYFINGRLCRLKDIQDLFMDTGMGSNAYSMIEQRMVEAVLSDRAEERRFLFEEAAGIQKYKQRRRFAMRKLEATEGDLQRLGDIVAEVQRTVGSLGRQVAKARRYQKLSELLRRVSVTLAREELAALAAERKPLAERLLSLKERLAELAAAESTRAARTEELHGRINQRQAQAEELFTELAELNRGIREAEDELTANREKRAASADWIAEAGKRLETLTVNIQARETELAEFDSRVDELAAEVKSCEQEYAEARRAADEKAQDERLARANLAAEQRRREELAGRATSCTSRAEAIEDAAAYERKRAAELIERIRALAGKHEETAGRLAALEEKISAAEEEAKVRRRELAACEERLGQARERLTGIEKEITAESIARDRLLSEKELLDRLQREMEGFGEGVKALFTGEAAADGLEAVAAEVFRTEERFERAVESALGIRIQSVVTRDTAAMLAAIGRLKRTDGGSATFISRDLVNGYRARNGRIDIPVLAWCEDVVRCAGEYDFLKKLLLSDVAIVEDLPTAIALQKRSEEPLNLVTLSGETLNMYAVSGGASTATRTGSALLNRRRRLNDIEAEIASAGAKAASLQVELEKAGRSLRLLEQEREEHQAALAELEEGTSDLRSSRDRLDLEAANLTSSREEAESRAAEAGEKAAGLAAEKDELIRRAGQAQAELAEVEKAIELATRRVEACEAADRQDGGALQDVSLRLAEKRARLSEVEKSRSLMERELEAARGDKARLAEDIESRKGLTRTLKERDQVLHAGLEEAFGRREELTAARDEHEAALAELRQEIDQIETELRGLRKEKEQASEARYQVELELERITSRHNLVTGRISDNFNLDLENLDEDFPFFPDPEERERGETASRELAEDLQDKIAKLGPVNVLSLEEYDREKERLDFLERQRDDLVSARNSLLRLIEEINKTARERFLDTFRQVQDNFQDIFSSLFEGGTAHVSLADESDPLESPIEVIARPRGKKMLGLGLLSGGEKALTALALLFAIYTVKPSPFCILDEADAPLDDANIDRFLTIIRRYARSTQFVMVTHNKRTMESADCLYGVTMQELGVSKVVSVQLNQVGDNGRIEIGEEVPAEVK